MANKKKTIQEALAEVQRKVNEARIENAKTMWGQVNEWGEKIVGDVGADLLTSFLNKNATGAITKKATGAITKKATSGIGDEATSAATSAGSSASVGGATPAKSFAPSPTAPAPAAPSPAPDVVTPTPYTKPVAPSPTAPAPGGPTVPSTTPAVKPAPSTSPAKTPNPAAPKPAEPEVTPGKAPEVRPGRGTTPTSNPAAKAITIGALGLGAVGAIKNSGETQPATATDGATKPAGAGSPPAAAATAPSLPAAVPPTSSLQKLDVDKDAGHYTLQALAGWDKDKKTAGSSDYSNIGIKNFQDKGGLAPTGPVVGSKEDVMALQKTLNDKTGANLKVDGIYGNQTRAAVGGFQQMHNKAIEDQAKTSGASVAAQPRDLVLPNEKGGIYSKDAQGKITSPYDTQTSTSGSAPKPAASTSTTAPAATPTPAPASSGSNISLGTNNNLPSISMGSNSSSNSTSSNKDEEDESGGKKKKVNESALISAFLSLQGKTSSNPNIFEAAKGLSPKQKEIASLAGDKKKIDADDLAALRRGASIKEGKAKPEDSDTFTGAVSSGGKTVVSPTASREAPTTTAPMPTARPAGIGTNSMPSQSDADKTLDAMKNSPNNASKEEKESGKTRLKEDTIFIFERNNPFGRRDLKEIYKSQYDSRKHTIVSEGRKEGEEEESSSLSTQQKKFTPIKNVEEDKWIKGAIKHPGALHKALGVPEDETIPSSELSAAAEKGGKIGKEARLAQTLKKFHKEDVELSDYEIERLNRIFNNFK